MDPIDLDDSGTYWVTVAPIDAGQGRAFVSTTSGLNGIGDPLGNGMSFFDSTFFGFNFEPVENVIGPGTWNFALGVIGSCANANQ
jgi:hypothetical protein